MVKLIRLTKGAVAVVDDGDVDLVSQVSWHCRVHKKGSRYAGTSVVVDGVQKTICMHRLITGAPVGFDVDHKDADGLNSRRSNLRVCTHAQNSRNRTAWGASEILGVRRDSGRARRKPWRATIGKQYLGRFETA